ncbi:hypothetical protein [Nocardia sp. alder85J]|uniref:hypothetical protein n=1 Tax=Nocardia sp. alder85J TaxID=2862949 RepID=UPI001CD39E31|nr:hypothetical protein [Nocardia sp. alder85J]MCX4094695.1 hypothetical protein [Nocardia sp. alder85J]
MDITTIAMTVDRFDMSATEYSAFAQIYGRDVTRQSEYETLRAVRELTMVTWLMQIIDVSPRHAAEFRHRVASLRAGDTRQRWNAF